MFAAYAGDNRKVKKLVDDSCAKIGVAVSDLHSTMGRLCARAMRAHLMADYSLEYLDKLVENIAKGDKAYANPIEIPQGEYRGVGFHEAPARFPLPLDRDQGSEDTELPSSGPLHLECLAPRRERLGPYEAALLGNPVVQSDKPLEVLRTIHSFDPCIACAVHTIDPEGKEITQVKVL